MGRKNSEWDGTQGADEEKQRGSTGRPGGTEGRGAARRKKLAARRAAARRAQVRRRVLLASGSVVAVAAVVVSLVAVKAGAAPGTAASGASGPTGAALRSLVHDVTSVPSSVLDRVGTGSVAASDFGGDNPEGALAKVSGPPLTSGGKPELLFMGANYCPYCAAERWPLIIALSRFGAFSGLTATTSSMTDVSPGTPTFSFYGSKYTSRYLSFESVEETENYREGHSSSASVPYVPLQAPTAGQQALLEKYDGGAIPFLDLGNRFVQVGDLNSYGAQDLKGLSWSQVAAALRAPSSSAARKIDASANYLTAAICKLTGNQPAAACTPAVKAIEAGL